MSAYRDEYTPIEDARAPNSRRLKFEAGDWYQNPKARPERLMLNSLSSDARRVYARIELATMGYGRETAVTTEAKNRQRPLTLGDIARDTKLDARSVRRAFAELEEQGLAERRSIDDGPLRKGKVVIFSAASPPAKPKTKTAETNSGSAPPQFEGKTTRAFPSSWAPLVALANRLKIDIDAPDIEAARDLIAEGEAAARDLENAEKRARAVLEQVRAQTVSSPHIRKKETERNTERDKSAAAASSPSESPPPVVSLLVHRNTDEDVERVAVSLSQTGPADLGAARSLLGRCRKKAADATVEAICAFIDLKAPHAAKADKPIGMLLTSVPAMFEGDWRGRLRTQAEDPVIRLMRERYERGEPPL